MSEPVQTIRSMKEWSDAVLSGVRPGQPRWWHLYGAGVPEGHELAGCYFQIEVGPCEQSPEWAAVNLPTSYEIQVPLLGSWDHRPTINEKNVVLPEDHQGEQGDDEDEYGDPIPYEDEDDDWY